MPVRAIAFFLLIAAFAGYTTRSAYANGRFPLAQQLIVAPRSATPPGAPPLLVLRSTFGLLVSRDGGRTFRWVCEQTFGYSGTWDPPLAFGKDGTLYVGLESGLAYTRDFCKVSRVPELEGETVKDLSVDSAGVALVVTTTPGRPSALFRGVAGGRFERGGKGLEDMYIVTVDAAPSRPSRVYVSGQPNGTLKGRLFRSDDGGRRFVAHDQVRSHDGAYFLIGVDPKNPDRVLSRFLHLEGSEVALSEDAGKTTRTVLSIPSAMYGAAISPDGARVWAGSGLPADGVFLSNDRGRTFARASHVGVQCLTATDAALYQCANPFTLGGPALGASTDDGASFRTLSSFANVEGAEPCDGRLKGPCGESYLEVRATLAPWRDAGADEAGAGAADEAGVGSDAGSAVGGPGSEPGEAAPRRGRGCLCVGAPGTAPGGGWDLAIATAVAGLAGLARRRGLGRAHPTHGRTDPTAGVPCAPGSTSLGR